MPYVKTQVTKYRDCGDCTGGAIRVEEPPVVEGGPKIVRYQQCSSCTGGKIAYQDWEMVWVDPST